MSRYFHNFSRKTRCYFALEARFYHRKWAYKQSRVPAACTTHRPQSLFRYVTSTPRSSCISSKQLLLLVAISLRQPVQSVSSLQKTSACNSAGRVGTSTEIPARGSNGSCGRGGLIGNNDSRTAGHDSLKHPFRYRKVISKHQNGR